VFATKRSFKKQRERVCVCVREDTSSGVFVKEFQGERERERNIQIFL